MGKGAFAIHLRSLATLVALFGVLIGGCQPTTNPPTIPLATPTAALDSVLPQAWSLCEAAFSVQIKSGAPIAFPVLTLLESEFEVDNAYGEGPPKTGQYPLKHIEALSAGEIRTLVCIRQDREVSDYYSGGAKAYILLWDVRVVRWPDGDVIAGESFVGSDYFSSTIISTEPVNEVYGFEADFELSEWLFCTLEREETSLPDATLLLTQEGFPMGLSPDGALLASGYDWSSVQIWRISDSGLLQTLAGHDDMVNDVAFSPDGTLIATASWDTTVGLWRISDGALLQTLQGHTEELHSVAFSPDGTLIASTSRDGTLRLWRVPDGTLLRTLDIDNSYAVDVAFSPDGTRMALATWDNTAQIWQVSDGTLLRTLTGHTDYVNRVAFSPDGTLIASASNDGTVRLWRASDGVLQRTLTGHTDWVDSIAFSSDGTLIASGSPDSSVRLWRVSDGALLRTIQRGRGWSYDVSFSPSGDLLVTELSCGDMALYRFSTEITSE